MEKEVTVVVLAFSVFCAGQTWAHGLRGSSGGHSGHVGRSHFSRGFATPGAFRGNFGSPSLHFRFENPQLGRHGSGHFNHPRHERFLGPHHHFRPFVSPGHRQHFAPKWFFGPHRHFGHGGFEFRSFTFPWGLGFRSFGFSSDFSSRTWAGPAGPPPLGAPGLPPLGAPGPAPFPSPGQPTVVISSPFFCYPHGLGFTDQSQFLDHLQQFHGILPRRAFSFCTPVTNGSRWIFFGF